MGFCDSSQNQSSSQGWQDPLGPTSMKNGQPVFSATGAPQMRSQIFNYLNQYEPSMIQAGQNLATSLNSAASNPGWNIVANNATQTASGNYLNGGTDLNNAMAANTRQQMAAAADQNARTQSDFTKNRMDFSTGNQQAAQANTATAAANAANTNAQTYLQNYLAERNNQNNAGTQLNTAVSSPLNYLQGVSGAYTQPLNQAGNLLSSLSSGGQVFQTGESGSYSPSTGSDILNGIGAL